MHSSNALAPAIVPRLRRLALLFVTTLVCLFTGSLHAQTVVKQINAGGPAVAPFAADNSFSAGNTFSSTAAINLTGVTNPAPQAVYQTVRWNASFNYTLTGLTAGSSYLVRLHFVELSFGAAAQRQFNVAINGTSVLTNFDIFATAGAMNKAVISEFTATANASGQIVVAFTQGAHDNPSIAGLEVLTAASGQTPFGGVNWSINNGATIQAENYDVGGEGVAYHDTTAGNAGGQYRSDGVDIEACTDTGGGFNVGWTVDGEWLEYTTNTTAGTYNIVVRGASASTLTGTKSVQVLLDGTLLGTATIAITGGWQTWQDFTISGVNIPGGTGKVLRLQIVGGDFNINYVRFATTAATYPLTVSSGSGSGTYAAGTVVSISANPPPAGQLFTGWTGGTAANFGNAASSATTYTTIAAAQTITANYGPATTYPLTVSSGTGSGNYVAGTVVNIVANTPPAGQVFAGWTGGTAANFANAASASTTYTTIAAAQTITATYKAATTYALTVSSGSGSGNYIAGSVVNIVANAAPAGQVFTGWTGGTAANFGNAASASTTYTTIAAAQTITANYGPSTPPNQPVIRINAGGPAVSPFIADTDFDVGTAFSSGATISTAGVTNAAPAAVYQTVRWNGSFNYTIPGLTAGTKYIVRLHFVELSFTTAGSRKFNVAINGTSVLSAFDVFATAGANAAVVRDFAATANSSGQIAIAFTNGGADNPDVAGIEIWTMPAIPPAPTSVIATAGNSQVSLSWANASGATSYNVYRGTTANGESATAIATGVTAINYTDSTVANGTTYYYKVAAVNIAGTSPMSAEVSGTPRLTAPPTPGGLSALAGSGQVSLSWGASATATSYSVYRGTSSNGEGATAYASNITTTSYTDNSVTNGTTYYYKVAAVNSAGTSGMSNEASAAPGSQGASFPYIRYEAESGTAAGGATQKSSTNLDKMNLATQASGQKYVELTSSGSSVQFGITAATGTRAGITMRFTLPDTADGMGQSGSVDCYVNGTKVSTIALTSYYAWQYFGGGGDPADSNNGGVPAFAFDEVHWLLANPLNVGDTVRIQSTGGPVVGVDFIEVEGVAAALGAPAGAVNVTSYGASSGAADNLAAFNSAVAAAVASSSKILYIPAGTYKLSSMWVIGTAISNPISKLTIVGDGIWYTNIQFTNPNVGGGGCSIRLSATGQMDFSNMYLNSNLRTRYNENAIYKAFMDNFGVNSHFHDLWEEHFECGFWVADYAYNPCQIASGLVIERCRIRNNLADGVNFCNGTHDSVVQNCSIRNGGDDGLAVWPNNFNGAPVAVNDTFTHNTIEFEWRSAGIAFYGGSGHKATFNYMKDMFMSAGFRSNTTFPGYHFESNTGITVSDTTMVNCGTSYDAWAGELGAVDLEASNTSITNFNFSNINVLNAQRDGYAFGFAGGFSGIHFTSCNVNGTGRDGITTSKYSTAHLGAGIYTYSAGSATFTSFTYSNCAGGELWNQGGFVLTFN